MQFRMQFRSFKIGSRLAAGFALVLAIASGVAGIGIWRLQDLSAATRRLVAEDSERVSLSLQWKHAADINWARTRAALLDADLKHMRAWNDEIDRLTETSVAVRKRLGDLAVTPREQELIAQAEAARAAYRGPRADLFKRRIAGEDVSREVTERLAALAESFTAGVGKLEDHERVRYQESLHQVERNASQGIAIMLAGSLVALLLGAVAAWAIGRSIRTPLVQAAAAARTIQRGDLTQALDDSGADEAADVMHALRDMQAAVARSVGAVRLSTDSIASASHQIASGNADLSRRTEAQASALGQTAASVEELTGTVRQNESNARQANELAHSASDVARRGGEVVGEVVQTMETIKTDSQKIAEIIGVIDGIAFQTNILALNAAVEAARAGEQGRGFAVVASEVRALAQRTGTAAREIKALIENSVGRVEAGTGQVARAGRTMQEVVDSIRRVSELMNDIAAASREQTRGIEQVSQAVGEMDKVTEQNAALVEEAAAAADSMRGQAAELVQAVSVFRLQADQESERVIAAARASGRPPVAAALAA